MVTLLEKSQPYYPLNADQVSKLRSLRAKDKPPSKVILNMDTFRLPEDAKASLVKVKGAARMFRIQVTLPGKTLGHSAMFKNIAIESPKISSSKRRSLRAVKDDYGVRPSHLTVNFIPKK